jgi:isopentenyl-diphosphate delta-isomerase
MSTEKRKRDHINVCLAEDVEFFKSSGFGDYQFTHNALPEIDWDGIDISTRFLGRNFRAPLFIEAMTGGTKVAEKINKNLAKAAQELGIGMGVGSQRAMIENPALAHTFKVKDVAPDIFLVGNIGASHLLIYSTEQLRKALDDIRADALAVHLNPAQEIAQDDGHKKWKGILAEIKGVCSELDRPVIVKEVGCGLSGEVAKRLEKTGVEVIDVAGAGGTSWVKVDSIIGGKPFDSFFEWGIPTAEALEQCLRAVKVPVIASGGIRNGIEAAKALSMGASLAGMALPLLKPAAESHDAVKQVLEKVITELKTAMLLTSSKNLSELRGKAVKI